MNYPAFPSAGPLSLNQRGARDEERRKESEEAFAWVAARKDKRHQESEEIFAWVAARKDAANEVDGIVTTGPCDD